MKKLSGKTALITGGCSGIGLAIASHFNAHGAQLMLTGRNLDLFHTAKQLLGDATHIVQSDTGDLHAIHQLMHTAREVLTTIDVLCINAAIAAPAPFEHVTEHQFDAITATNFKGAYFTIQQALPLLAPQASIIVITSIANQMGSPNFSVYAACKAAQRSLVQTLALELIPRGIRINAISPGPIATPMWNKMGLPDNLANSLKQDVANKSPSKRFGTPEEIAKVALFLACEDSSYIVGEEIVVDGGMALL